MAIESSEQSNPATDRMPFLPSPFRNSLHPSPSAFTFRVAGAAGRGHGLHFLVIPFTFLAVRACRPPSMPCRLVAVAQALLSLSGYFERTGAPSHRAEVKCRNESAVKCSEFLRDCPSAVSRLLGHLWSAPVTFGWPAWALWPTLRSSLASLSLEPIGAERPLASLASQRLFPARSWNLSRRWPSLAPCVPNRFSR